MKFLLFLACFLGLDGLSAFDNILIANMSRSEPIRVNLLTYEQLAKNKSGRAQDHSLVLNSMQVDAIERRAFHRYDPQLVSIFLDSNRLVSVLDNQLAFAGLSDLEILSIASNQIREIEPNAFKDLVKLQYLNLASNQLQYFHNHLFSTVAALRVLDLSNNKLVYLDENCFSHMPSLRVLKLKNNQIKKLESGTFAPLTSLLRLDLSSNKLTSINGLFDSESAQTGSLADLNLKQNALIQLPANAFSRHRASLSRLDLSFNRLTHLNESSLNQLTNLTELFLQNNLIKAVEWGSLRFLNGLQTLSLAANQLTNSGLYKDTFWNLTQLNYLDLSFNGLSKLESNTFDHMSRLYTLVIANNNISRVQASAFFQMPKLENLDLSGNVLRDFDPSWFVNLPGLNFLKLDSNLIRSLNASAFSSLPGIKYLYLSGNNLTSINNDAFKGLPNMSVLHLDRNSLGAISDQVFDQDLRSLKSLHLNSNQLKTLSLGLFSKLPRLEAIDLSDNQLVKVDLKAFENLVFLNKLNLSSNPLANIGSAGQNSKCVQTLAVDPSSFFRLEKKGKCYQVVCNQKGSECFQGRSDQGSCRSRPCKNNAKCVENASQYVCICPSGFSGLQCDTFDCRCQNNGTCVQTMRFKYCKCPIAFTGSQCQIPRVSVNLARSLNSPLALLNLLQPSTDTAPPQGVSNATKPSAGEGTDSVLNVLHSFFNSFLKKFMTK